MVLGMGTVLTFGIFLNGLMNTFGASFGSTSLITSIQGGTVFCISPIVSYLIRKFGCRTTTLVGSFVAAIGLFTSGWVQSIVFLYITAGVVTGNFFRVILLIIVGLATEATAF